MENREHREYYGCSDKSPRKSRLCAAEREIAHQARVPIAVIQINGEHARRIRTHVSAPHGKQHCLEQAAR